MLEPKPKIKTVRQLERELPSPTNSARSEKDQKRILDKIRKLKEQQKLT